MKYKVLNIILKVLSLFMCILLFFAVNIYLIIHNVNKIVTKDNVVQIISNVDYNYLLSEKNMDSLYKISDQHQIDRRIIDGIVNSNEVKTMIANYFGNMIDTLFYGAKVQDLTSREVIDTIESVFDRSAHEMGYSISDEQRDLLIEELEKQQYIISDAFPSYSEITKNLNQEDLQALSNIFSNDAKILIMIIIIVMIIIIFLLRWSWYRFALWTGITMIMSSLPYLFVSVLGKDFFYSLFKKEIPMFAFEILEQNVCNFLLTSGLITLIIGIALLIYYIVMKKVLCKNY